MTELFAIRTKDLAKNFDGVYAVKDFSVELYGGQITGIIGPNGSGKTTLINLISGRYFADAGTLEFARSGRVIRHLEPQQAAPFGVTRTFQSVHVFGQMTVEGNLFNVLTPRNPFHALFSRRGRAAKERITALLTRLGLLDKRHEHAEKLSFGQKRLLEIGRALLMDADIFCFDEPFAGLSAVIIDQVKAIFGELKAQGKCVLWVEHNMSLIKELSDRVLFMDNGRLIADGTATEVFARHEVLEAYLGQ
jgi:ABC-type branched-subunit amino acid transport system ATPase component